MIATMMGNDFNKLIGATKKFTAKVDNKPILHFIRLEFLKKTQSVRAIAIDGYRMSIEHSVCGSVDEDFTAYVLPSMRTLSRGDVIIDLQFDKLIIRDGDTLYGFMQPNGEYIDINKVLSDCESKPPQYEISFNAEFMIDALQAAKANAVDRHNAIAFEFRGEHDPIILRTGDKNIKFVLPIKTYKRK